MTIADDMVAFYSAQLGHQGSLIELEREYFILSLGDGVYTRTWADAALAYFASWNGSNPAGSLSDEAFKYYSSLSGLTPVNSYTLADHMAATYSTGPGGAGGLNNTPPITDNLEAFYDANNIDGYQNDSRVSKNLLSVNQASVETDTSGLSDGLGAATVARTTAQALDGSASLQATFTSASSCAVGVSGGSVATSGIVPGQTYTGVISSRAAAVPLTGACRIYWYDAAGGFLSSSTGTVVANITTGWTKHTVTGVAPTLAVKAAVTWVSSVAGGIGNVYYVDCIGLWLGSSTDWVLPGKLHNQNLLNYDQATIDNLSTLTGAPPGFQAQSGNSVFAKTSSPVASGSAALQITSNNTSAMVFSIYAVNLTDRVPVVAGKTYTLVYKVRSAVTPRNCYAQIYWYSAAGGASLSNVSGTVVSSTTSGWTTVYLTAVAPATAAWAFPHFGINSAASSEVHYMDELGFWEGSDPAWAPPYRGIGANGIQDGTPINFWRDLSGKDRHLTQQTVANQPILRKPPTGVVSRNMLTYVDATFSGSNGAWVAGTGGQTLSNDNTDGVITPLGSYKSVRTSVTGDIAVTTGPLVSSYSVIAGRSYTAMTYVKAVGANMNAAIYINWFNAAGTYISSSATGIFSANTTDWLRIYIVATAPANTVYGQINLQGPGSTVTIGNGLKWDDAGLWETISANNLEWVAPGLQFNNLLKYDAATTEGSGTIVNWSTVNCGISRVTTPVVGGLNAMQMSSTAGGDMRVESGTQIAVGNTQYAAVTPGQTYTAVCFIRSAVSVRQTRIEIHWLDSLGVDLSVPVNGTLTNDSTTGWTLLTVSGPAPAAGVWANIKIRIFATGGAAELHYVDNVGLTLGTSTTWQSPVTIPNNKATVQFDGKDDFLNALTNYSNDNKPGFMIYAIYNRDFANALNNRVLVTLTGAGTYRAALQVTGTGTLQLTARRLDADAPVTVNGSTLGPGAYYAHTNKFEWSGGLYTIFYNGALNNTGVPASNGNSDVTSNAQSFIGGFTSGESLCGSIVALLVYSGAHTTAQRLQIERWLGARFGVTVA